LCVVKPAKPRVLDLTLLPACVSLSRPVVEAVALAASVCLQSKHKARKRYKAALHQGARQEAAEIVPTPVTPIDEETYNDVQEATEEGAEAIALSAAYVALDRVAFRRPPKGTGADYLLHPVDAPDGDRYERLECSGLGEGDERADTRLREKVRQLARFPDGPPGWAAVTDFRDLPIALHLGRWEASR